MLSPPTKLARKLVPRAIKQRIRRYLDARKKIRLFGELAHLVPDVGNMFDGPASLEEFKANGEEFLEVYRNFCELRRDAAFLDIGSGLGRKTIPLTRYLSRDASYVGLDVNPDGIAWCQQRITPEYPNFRFQWVNVRNQFYNPTGSTEPYAYRFPFAHRAFSFIAANSVFTHMLPDDVRHYLSEIHRVMKPGRFLASYFLLNEKSERLIASGASSLAFKRADGLHATISAAAPEIAVALDETFVRAIYRELGLTIEKLAYGSWCGRADFLSYQDLVLATKHQ